VHEEISDPHFGFDVGRVGPGLEMRAAERIYHRPDVPVPFKTSRRRHVFDEKGGGVMMRIRLILVIAAAFGALAASAQTPALSNDPAQVHPGSYVLDKNHGKITWSVNHLGFSTYYGQFTDVNAQLTLDPKDVTKSTLDVTVNTAGVGTFNPKLDEHLKSPEFLNVSAFPTATFKATKIERTGPKDAKITGDLTLLGVTKPVVVDATFNQAGPFMDNTYRIGFNGMAAIKRSDFGIKAFLPYLGDEVQLIIEAEFKAAS
jgi:polyisoprenoid-binding protein YceI